MKHRLILSVVTGFALVAVGVLTGIRFNEGAAAQPANPAGVVHVVFFKLKADAPKEAADLVIKEAHRLLTKVPVVRDVKAGRRAPGDRPIHIKDYDVGLYVYFDRLEDIQTYLDHPLHVEYAKKVGEVVESVRVADFYSE